MTMKKEKAEPRCKHEDGWMAEEHVNVFVHPDSGISFDFQDGKRAKLKAICNNPDCDATRNIYIEQRFGVGFGRIHRRRRAETDR